MTRSPLAEIQTPCLLLDRGRLDRNLAAMTRRLAMLGVPLRPHLKTAKCPEVARLALAGGARGIAVSTMAEAEAFAEAGVTDVLYAVGVAPAKLARAAALRHRGVDLTLILDHPETAHAVAAAGREFNARFRVLIEIDCGQGRAGVAPDSADLASIALALRNRPGAELRGVLTHAGQSYRCTTPDEMAAVAETERSAAVAAADRLRSFGLEVSMVSVGSTPTARFGRCFAGVTEVRAGVYMFGDLFQAGLGTCAYDDIAVSVLATVIGHRRDRGHLLIDAGSLALSPDRSTAGRPFDAGYGLVADAAGRPIEPSLTVAWVNQEHGVIPIADPAWFERLPPGALVRLLPNHACITAAMFDRYVVLEDGEPRGVWRRVTGW